MASDNNKINELAKEASGATTSDLEILSMDLVPTDEELEMDANTFSLDDSDAGDNDIANLRSDIRSKNERISDLQFDIEQLRARWTGLEKEIEAREELTEILQTDLKAAHKRLAAKDKALSRNERDLADLGAKLDAAQAAHDAADAEITAAQSRVEEFEAARAEQAGRIAELERDVEAAAAAARPDDAGVQQKIDEARVTIAELNTYVDGRKSDWERQAGEIEALRSEMSQNETMLGERDFALEQSRQTFEKTEAERLRLAEALDTSRTELKALEGERRRLEAELDQYQRIDRVANEQRIAEQAGEIAGDREKIREIQAVLARSETYADELRRRIDDKQDASRTASDLEGVAEQQRIEAEATIADLTERMSTEQEASAGLREHVRELEDRLDKESDGLRQEFDDARSALEESEAINEQLTSDLIDSNAFKQALEEQLDTINESHGEEIEKLEKRIAKLQLLVDDYERKISNKDNAISALLNELANKSRTLDSIDEIENVIHEIDDRMSERIDDRVAQDRERPTRLLIGTIDGQELRFPLFKDRLTIGRTVHNDIQLRTQFISRRHAVVLADEQGTKIVDWGSKNGVYVNNARVSEQSLKSGDKVMIGTAEFTYEELPRRPSD